MANAAYYHWLWSVPLGITITILGLIGNIISIVVWRKVLHSKLRQNQSTGLYLIALAYTDTGLLVFFFLQDSLPSSFTSLKTTSYPFAVFYCYIAFPLFFIFLISSIWLVVGVTINRFVMIAFPTKVRSWYSKKNTYIGIGVFYVFSLIINVPHFFNYHPVPNNNNQGYMVAPTYYGSTEGSKNYEFWVHCIFLVLAPWITIATLNTLIVYRLYQQGKQFRSKDPLKEGKGKQERREMQMTRTLLVVTFTFLILLVWQCITQCFWMLDYQKGMEGGSWPIVDSSFAFAKMGVIINSSINVVLYCFTGSMFKKEFYKLIGVHKYTSFGSSANSSSEASSKEKYTVSEQTSKV